MFEGYGRYSRKRRRKGSRSRRVGGRRGAQRKLARAAKHCKGQTRGKFRACIKNYFKRH